MELNYLADNVSIIYDALTEIYNTETEIKKLNQKLDKEKTTMKTNEMNLSIYVTDEDVQNNFSICRPDCIDDDDYQERCDSLDMCELDIDIALIRKGNIQYTLFTSGNLWNVYCIKEQYNEHGVWETIEVDNITSYIDNWENVQDLTSYLLDLKLKEEIKQKNIVEFLENKIKNNEAILADAYWLDTVTFYTSFAFSPEELKIFFPDLIKNNEDCYLCAEYHEDNHEFIYELIFDCDRISVKDNIQSTLIDWYIINQAKEF